MVSKARACSIWVRAAFSGAPSMTATSTIKLSKAARYWREEERERGRQKKGKKDEHHVFFYCFRLLSVLLPNTDATRH